jgi:hypothetical protein
LAGYGWKFAKIDITVTTRSVKRPKCWVIKYKFRISVYRGNGWFISNI